jgi:hypothetical protein
VVACRQSLRAIFADSLIGNTESHDLRLLSSQTSTEKCTYVSTGFSNLKMAAEPISEEFEKYLLLSLIEELNHLFPMDLATDFICDGYMDSDVFNENMMNRTALILISASHLHNIERLFRIGGSLTSQLRGGESPKTMSKRKFKRLGI